MGREIVDLTGVTFGRLRVLHRGEDIKHGRKKYHCWVCDCSCGSVSTVITKSLLSGVTQSCGCLRTELLKDRATTHGDTNTRFYNLWNNLVTRHPLSDDYSDTVCEEWLKYEKFKEDMYDRYSADLTLDRIDITVIYCKSNCKWGTRSVQTFNRRKKTTNTSGKTGVAFNKITNKWYSYIGIDNKMKRLGYFYTFEEAVTAREAAELKYYGFIKKE